jgi:hypothetical protein
MNDNFYNMNDNKDLFDKLKKQLMMLDPVMFCEHFLTLDGKQFRLHNNGYKPFADIYRYIGIKALEPNAKPVIMVKGRQVGATTMASALEMYFMGSGMFGTGDKPPIRIIHAFPQLELAAAYSKTKLNQIISSSITLDTGDKKSSAKPKSYMQSLLDQSTATNDSLHFKQFIGGNHLWVESVGLDGDRIMGRTADVIFFDECQKTTGMAIGNSLKVLTTAKYGKPSKGVQVYFGTPRRKGSDFHKMWQTSSQQYYYLGCGKCKEHFPLYTPGSDDWEKIWLYGYIVKCTHCGHEQDKREAAERGKWVSLKNLDDDDCLMVGFHINQLYMPVFTKEDIINEKPGVHPINTERVYKNEVLGEFYQGDASPISSEEIREICADVGRKFKARIEPDENQIVVLGIDYGARSDLEQLANPDRAKPAGQSYSTAVVMSSKGSGLLSIEFATKFKRNDPESKKGLIDQLMRQYSVQLAIGDIGFSNDFSHIMHSAYGDKYLVSRAHPKVNNHVKYSQDAFPKEIVFERDYYIGECYEQMKKGQIRFPFGDYEKIAWLIEHCTSMEIKPSISAVGEHSKHYVKGGTPNDGFMALLNAYIAYKFILTKGFSIYNPYVQQKSIKEMNKPLIISGYVPRKF